MVVCRNAGRYYKVANRSDFYHDFLRSLFDTKDFPAFYDNRVACIKSFISEFGFLPQINIHDENKDEHYIYFYNKLDNCIASITIREVIMKMYNDDAQFEYALKSLLYTKKTFDLFSEYIEKNQNVKILLKLAETDFSPYDGEESIDHIEDDTLSKIIDESKNCKTMFGIDKPQNKISQKRLAKMEAHYGQ